MRATHLWRLLRASEHAALLDRRCGKFKGDRQKVIDAVFSIGLEALAEEDAAE